jgi:ferredoxin
LPKITFEREDIVVEARPGQTVLEVAEQAGVSVFRGMWPGLHCGGMKGWCNRCKVWVKPLEANAVNPPTATERSPLRLNGRVRGSMRLACQVQVTGDVVVHTRAGGPEVRQTTQWDPVPGPTRWKERWEKRHESKDKDDDEEADAAPKKKAAAASNGVATEAAPAKTEG